MMTPQTVRVISGHRAGQIGLATEQTSNGYWVRFYAVHDPKTTNESEIIQSLHKGHAASVMKLHASELDFQ